jgi:hypothetical protein
MHNLDFMTLVLLIIGSLLTGSLLQSYIDRKRDNRPYGWTLTFSITSLIFLFAILLYIYQTS